MKKILQDKLATVGIVIEKYHVDAPHFGWFETDDDAELEKIQARLEDFQARGVSTAPVWGIALIHHGNEVAVIEQTPRAHDYSQDGKYHLRARRTVSGEERAPSLGAFKTQREAVAGYIRKAYAL